MSHVICLNSFNLFEDPKYISIGDRDLNYELLFSLEKTMRTAVASNPFAEWSDIHRALHQNGFDVLDTTMGSENIHQLYTVFVHSRYWDEHLTPSAKSFFVSFPDSAPAEIRGQILFATNYASLFALVSTEHMPSHSLILLNSEHEPIYPEDTVLDLTNLDELPIGPIFLIDEQFSSEQEYLLAKEDLLGSGFEIFEITDIRVS